MRRQFGSYTVDGKIVLLLLIMDFILKIIFSFFRIFSARKLHTAEIDPSMVKKILIIEIMGLGDAVIASAPVRPLKLKYPNAQISLLGNPAFTPALFNAFDNCFPFSAPWVRKKSKLLWLQGWKSFLHDIKIIRRENFDISIDARCDYRSAFLAWLIGAEHRLGFDFGIGKYFYTDAVPYGVIVRRSQDYAKILERLKVDFSNCSPYIYNSVDFQQGFAEFKKYYGLIEQEYYLVHPGAARKYKKWPVGFFAEVVNFLLLEHPDVTPIIIGGTEDKDIVLSLWKLTGEKAVIIVPSIEELPALTGGCKFVICNNSGIMHLAAALGKTTVVVQGPTDERIWSPDGFNHLIFQKSTGLDCHPCSEETCVRPKDPCIELVKPPEVIKGIVDKGLLE